MVNACRTTISLSKDTTSVVSPTVVASSDSHCHGTVLQLSSNIISGCGDLSGEANIDDITGGGWGRTDTVTGSVGVLRICHGTSGFPVIPSIDHPATIATVSLGDAVYGLLLRSTDSRLPIVDGLHAFKGGGSSECPA